jgi:vitamin B12 transporter
MTHPRLQGARRALRSDRVALALVVLLVAPSLRARDADEEIDALVGPAIEETVEVPGRLGTGGPQLKRGRAVSVERLDGEELRESCARSLPEFLAGSPGLTAVDETGNGRQLSIDVRGFAATPGATALVVDGVRLNDPDTGAASFELVRPIDVESVEIRKGPLGPLLGGGSLAGGVQVRRRRATREPVLDLRLTGGDDDLLGLDVFAAGPAGPFAIAGSASHQEAAAPRSGATMTETSGRMQLRRELGSFDLSLDVSGFDAAWDQPGALKADELASDPEQSVWNTLDETEHSQLLALATLEREGAGATDLRAVVSLREVHSETLTTGRSGFGFLTRQRTRSLQLTVEGLTRPPAAQRLSLRWGLETRRDDLSPEGWATTEIHDGGYDDAFLSSDVSVRWEGIAVWAGAVLDLPAAWTLEAGLRHDRSRVERSGFELDVLPEDTAGERDFSDTSWGLGLARRFEGDRFAGELRASWSQSFLAPSSVQLFAFPGFSANPELEPQQAEGLILGGSVAGRRIALDLELFSTEVEDEIVYDDANRKNLNAGRTRRRGAELRLGVAAHSRLSLELARTWTDAEFRASWDATDGPVPEGSEIPLVAPSRTLVGLDWRPAQGWRIGASWRRVSSSVASNDFDNSSERVPAHELVALNLRKSWSLSPGELSLGLAVDNLLDELVVTRGIEAGGELFLTPAPGRRISAGLDYRF